MRDDKDTRRRLLALLDRDLFDPVLSKTREHFGRLDDKHRYDDARRKIAREKSRYHDQCPSAQDIKENFFRDLESRSSHRLNENLRALGLPTYWDVRDDFVKLCETYGV